jgi:hypothetical protein
MRRILLLLSGLWILLIAGSCRVIYDTDISGFVRDVSIDSGVNGAVVRVYADDPAEAEDTEILLETATVMTTAGIPGYFSGTLMWQTRTGQFGQEGDIRDFWIRVSHDKYQEKTVKAAGLLSNADNIVPDILIERSVYEAVVAGKCYYLVGASEPSPIQGAEVSATLDGGDMVFHATSDATGVYTLNLEWTREDGYEPPDDAGPGEDSIEADIYFAPGTDPGNMYSFFPGDANTLSGKTIRSWLIPNYLPDAIDPDPTTN